jgi:hypothetical protein
MIENSLKLELKIKYNDLLKNRDYHISELINDSLIEDDDIKNFVNCFINEILEDALSHYNAIPDNISECIQLYCQDLNIIILLKYAQYFINENLNLRILIMETKDNLIKTSIENERLSNQYEQLQKQMTDMQSEFYKEIYYLKQAIHCQ